MTDPSPPLAIVGPTASGKTEAALSVAAALGAEIVSVDSMLVYRGMDLGTAKPSMEERDRVPHHLIDVADPQEPFSVARYQALVLEVLEGIRHRGRRALLAGGSGLYFRAAVDDLGFPGTDPATRAELEAQAEALGADACTRGWPSTGGRLEDRPRERPAHDPRARGRRRHRASVL
jgi:tRNA dimethylallyltransferase